jgi:sulfoxide reductase heme-binding subunit YedZ
MNNAFLKFTVLVLALTPALILGWQFAEGQLGANPVEALIQRTGIWTLRLLLITLFLTPASVMLGYNWPKRIRRMLGLFAFFYACLHMAGYIWLDQSFDWPEIGRDIIERRFITVGMFAFILLIPLAITSGRVAARKLGPVWKRLHRLIYLAAALGVLHFWWLVKADIREPLVYAVLLVLLLALRLPVVRRSITANKS